MVSLTSELRDGELGRWFRAHLPRGEAPAKRVAEAIGSRAPVRPTITRPGVEHYARVGAAFGQRLGFLVEAAPPYYALLGAHRAGLIAWGDVNALAQTFPTHADRSAPRGQPGEHRGLFDRPAPHGWIDLREFYSEGVRVAQHGSQTEVVVELTRRVADYLTCHAPAGGLASSRGAERGVLRGCVVLAGWEQAYRLGRLDPDDARRLHAARDARHLLNGVNDDVLAELVALSEVAYAAGGLDQLRDAAGDPASGCQLGHAGPVFAPDWADGDLLITHADPTVGNTLVDVKTVTHPGSPSRLLGWLHQVLAYAWLDHHDTGPGTGDWGITRVALYFARHGTLVVWPLDELVADLAADRSRAGQLPREFFDVLRRSLARQGVQVG